MLRLKGMILLLGIVLALLAVPMVKAVATTGNIIINEIMYDLPGSDDEHEWIEIYNNDSVEIEVKDWKFYENGENHGLSEILGTTRLGPGAFAIIAHNASQFQSDYPSFNGNLYYSSFSLSNTGENLILKDDDLNEMDSVTYSSSWGGDGNGKSLQLVLADGSWCEGPPTPGAANGCQYCGDGNCSVDESCANCTTDCLGTGEVCCDAIAYTGDCCVDVDCTSPNTCVSHTCTAPAHYCGDGNCDLDESCANCSADCLLAGEVCCDGINYIGNCCVDANCTSPQTCVDHTCTTLTHYCGDGTCDANETCANCAEDCEGKQDGCDSEYLCCYGSCAFVCSSDDDCLTGTVCRDPGTCNATCVDASEVVCDLTLSISAEEIFKSSIGEHYYLYVNDTKGNYTGSAVVGYWIEYSNGSYIRYHKPYNTTINVNVNKSRDYTPGEICGNKTYYIKAEIVDPKCNDTDLTNNAATKAVTIWGLDPKSAECFKNLTYSLEIPVEVKAEENFTISVEIKNNQNVSQKVEVWSYVYRWGKCYSCYWNKTEESNKQMISIPAGSSITVELQNKVNATNGTYYIKVKILKEGFSTPEELLYEVEVIREEAPIEEDMEGEGEGEVIYKSKAEKIKKIAMYALPALLLIVAIYFVIVKRKQINEFFTSKREELKKKRKWKKYLQKRRPGVIERLSKGFLKPGGEAKE